MSQTKKFRFKYISRKYGFKSGLENEIAEQLKSEGIDPQYEAVKLKYRETKEHIYTPDFPAGASIIIETKGHFTTSDRMKMLIIKETYPFLDFRFVFTNSNSKIYKGSKTTYGMWCEKNGFKYADKRIPDKWITEIKEDIEKFKKDIEK